MLPQNDPRSEKRSILIALVLLAIGGIALFIASQARGQGCYIDPSTGNQICPTRPSPLNRPVQWAGQAASNAVAQATVYDVRIEGPGGIGSGTAIIRIGNGTGFITNHHVAAEVGKQATIINGKGQRTQATLRISDPANDLALYYSPEKWPVTALSDVSRVTGKVYVRGYQPIISPTQTLLGFNFLVRSGPITSRGEVRHDNRTGVPVLDVRTGTTFRPGASGGGVFQNGKMVGVLWGSSRGEVSFTPIGPVRRLLNRVRGVVGAPPLVPIPSRPSTFPTPPPSTSSSSAPTNPSCVPPTCNCKANFAAIFRQLETLNAQIKQLNSETDSLKEILADMDNGLSAKVEALIASRLTTNEQKLLVLQTQVQAIINEQGDSNVQDEIAALRDEVSQLRKQIPVYTTITPRSS